MKTDLQRKRKRSAMLLQLGLTGFFGKPWPQPTPAETVLKRLRFDAVYKF